MSRRYWKSRRDSKRAGGYRFGTFDGPPSRGDVLLRHDVDLSLDAALRMAELEAEAGATATYFLMTESVFYNLASSEGQSALERLRALGHGVGLHAVWPSAALDDRFDPVVAWHNPDPEYYVEGSGLVRRVLGICRDCPQPLFLAHALQGKERLVSDSAITDRCFNCVDIPRQLGNVYGKDVSVLDVVAHVHALKSG